MEQSLSSNNSGQIPLIDRIVYLASLASDVRAIDAMMDTLRAITAVHQPDTPYSQEDMATLTRLEGDLKQYLTQRDPLRDFNNDSLEQSLRSQFQQRTRSAWDLVAAMGIAVAAGGLGFLAPLDSSSRTALGADILLLVLAIETSWFYLTALSNFKPQMWRVFMFLSAGIVLFAVGFSSYAMVQLLHVQDQPPFIYAGTNWFLTLALICMYAGLRRFAQVLQLKAWFLQWRYAIAASVLVAGIMAALPHHEPVASLPWFDFSLIGTALCAVIATFGIGAARVVIRTVTTVYVKPVRWFLCYLAFGWFICVGSTAGLLIQGQLQNSAQGLVAQLTSIFVSVLAQALLMYSGYAFKRQTR